MVEVTEDVKKLNGLEQHVYYKSRVRTRGFRDLGKNLFKTHRYVIPTITIPAGVFERSVGASYRGGPMTFATALAITAQDTQKGLIFGYGDLTSSIAMWVENLATAITSVTNSGGIARFNFTPGPTLAVDKIVSVSGFTTNPDYNVVGAVTTTGAGFFEIASVAFGSDEAGSFAFSSIGLQVGANEGAPNNDSTVLSADITGHPDGSVIELAAVMIPGGEMARLWVNGKVVARSDSTSGSYPSGVWSADGAGSFADIPKIVYSAIPAASRIAPSGFALVEPLSIYGGQFPRHFL